MKKKAIIESAYKHQSEENTPTLLKFQNGSLGIINKEHTQYCRMRKNNSIKAAMVVALGQVYHGLVGAAGGAAELETDLYICVRNKKTNKVRILPIEHVCLKNHIYNDLSKAQMNSLSTETAMKKMLQQFGGRSASRYLSKQENLKMDIDLFKDELEETVQEATITEDDTAVDDDKHLDIIRPKCNKEAKQLKDVYDIDDVVPKELLARLEEESKAVFGTSLKEMPINSEYLVKCIEKLQKATATAESLFKIKLIIYMDCLLNLINSRVRAMKKYELSRVTEKVENDVRTRFCDPNSKNCMRTALYSEKALCYFIVLALLISDNYQVDTNVLTQELRCARRKIIKFAQIVNARPKRGSDILSMCLPSKMSPLPNLGKKQRTK